MSRSSRPWSWLAFVVPLLAASVPAAAQLPTETPTVGNIVNGSYTLSWGELTGGATQATMSLRERFNAGAWGASINVTGTNSRGFTNKPPGAWGYQLQWREHDSESGTDTLHPWSAELTVNVPVAGAPGAPTNLTATPTQSTGSFTLAWGAASGAVDHYAVYRRIDPTLTWPTQPTWTPAGLSLPVTAADGHYFFRVQACNASNNCGVFSNIVEVTVLGVPGVPGSLGPNITTGTSYQLSWTAASGTVARYELQERVNLGPWVRIQNNLTRSRNFTEREEASYQYRVRACNSPAATALCGLYTATKTVTVLPPANITGPASSEGRFTLSWTVPPAPGNIPQLEQRVQGATTWGSARLAAGAASTLIYKVCAQCEHVWEFRLRFCEPPESEPGNTFPGSCDEPGRVHRVDVNHPTDDSRTLASLPLFSSLSQAERDAFADAVLRQGVNGRSPISAVGTQPQDKLWFRSLFGDHWEPTWFPVDGFKHTLCGEVAGYDVYDDHFFAGDFAETDFNHHIIPNLRHTYIRDQAGSSSRIDCSPPNMCVEAEATPDQAFFNNPWFSVNGTSLMGREMCVHGAWIGDDAHGRRPEIHPYELAWWKTFQAALNHTVYHLVTLKDDSQRFHRWGHSPYAEFWIPFDSFPTSAIFTFRTSEPGPWLRHVETNQHGPSTWDADDATSHLLEIDGRDIVQVFEDQPNDDTIGVRFEGLSREASGRVRGYVVIRTHVGTSAPDEAGFHVIRVDQDYGATSAPAAAQGPVERAPQPPAERRVRASFVPGSLRRVTQDGRTALVMDLEVGAASDDAAGKKPAVSAAFRRAGESRQPIRVAGQGAAGGEILRDVAVPLGDAAVIELRTETGDSLSRRLNGIGLAARLTSATPVAATGGRADWPATLRAAGGQRELPEPPADLVPVARWDVRLLNLYGIVREGQVGVDEESPLTRELNDALYGDGHQALTLFGSESPLRTDWSFAATDLNTGQAVPVVVGGKADATAVRVEIPAGRLAGERLSIVFPTQPEGHLYEVVATARSRDIFGVEGGLQHRFWNATVSAETPESLAAALLVPLASEAGLPASTLRAMAEAPAGADAGDPSQAPQRRARTLRTRARQAASDGHITIDELADLLKVADYLRKR